MRTRRPPTTRPAPWTRKPPAPPWPAFGHRSCWSRASTTSRSPKCAAEYAGLFPQAELAVQPGGGHYPWRDDPEWLVQTLAGFLP
jgi:pimeloyl-ACP methyl ester carboxylesterase